MMRLQFLSVLLSVWLAVDTFSGVLSAPVPAGGDVVVRDFEAREPELAVVDARAVKKVAVKPVAKRPVVKKPKPVAKKPVVKKPVAKPKPVVKKPIAKKPVAKPKAAPRPVAKPAVKKPVAKKPVAKPVAKKPVAKPAVKKPAVKAPVAKTAPVAKKPVAKPAAKKPVAKPAVKKPAVKAPVAKKAPAAKKPAAKPAAKTIPKKTSATTAKKTTPVAKKPVAKAPAKAPVAAKKPTAAKAAPAKAAKASGAKSAATPTKSCSAAQIEARDLALAEEERELELEARELERRLGLSHPAGTGRVTLFHGASSANAAALVSTGVNLAKTRGTGDFNHKPEVPGGFYLSDSLVAAAQFACYGIPGPKPAKVDVVEYTWSGAGQPVFTFPGQTQDWKDFQTFNQNANVELNTKSPFFAKAQAIYKNNMIVGPLNGPVDFDLTDSFQQYAVVNQAAATSNLKFVTNHANVLCENVPKGNKLSNSLYAQGQKTSSKFASRVQKLQNPKLESTLGCIIQ